MRVLSPRMLPPVRVDDGSTASTATRRPSPVSFVPSASMNVDLPTPGTPVMPTRWLATAFGSRRVSSSSARSRWSGWRRLDERDRLAEVAPVAGDDALFVCVEVDTARHASASAAFEIAEQVDDRVGDDRPRREDRRRPRLAEFVEVLRRDDAADDDHDVVTAQLGQLVAQLAARA